MESIYFHEDDYCQTELVPSENYESYYTQMDKAISFSSAHKSESGMGWTDSYAIERPKVQLSERKISRFELEDKLSCILPKVNRVISGYSSTEHLCSNIIAFGESRFLSDFFDFDEDKNIVNNIWLLLDIDSEEDVTVVIKMFSILEEYNLLLVDWGWETICHLNNYELINHYLEEKRAH